MKEIVGSEVIEAIIKEDKSVVIKIYTDWCGPCKMLKPIMTQIATQHTDVTFIEVDADEEENRDFVKKMKVSSVPTTLFYKNGELKNTYIGLQNAVQEITKNINDIK